VVLVRYHAVDTDAEIFTLRCAAFRCHVQSSFRILCMGRRARPVRYNRGSVPFGVAGGTFLYRAPFALRLDSIRFARGAPLAIPVVHPSQGLQKENAMRKNLF